MRRVWQAILLALVTVAVGCNGGAPGSASPAKPEAPIRRLASELPKVGEYQPPLDGGRLEVAPPEGWVLTSKGRTFLMGFKTKERDFPRITVNAEDPPSGSPPELTEEQADAFAARLDEELREAKKKVEEYSLPIILGETVFIRHVRQVMASSPCIVQSLQTVKNGRLYTVELIVEIDAPRASEYQKSLTDQRDFGYAVAANMRFAMPGEKFDPLTELKTAPAPAAKSAETKSGEPKTPKTAPVESPAAKPAADSANAKTAQPTDKKGQPKTVP